MDSRELLRRSVPSPLRRAVYAVDERLAEAQQRVFERRLGVSTSGHAYREDEGIDSERAFYEGCQWIPLRRVLASLDPGPSDVFVDLGSGKGQALLIAARFPYGRVLGVELMAELVADADANVRRAAPRLRARDVQSLAVDVNEWEIPPDLSTVFLYCPFMGELFYDTLQRIFASYDANPRPLRIVYDFPWEHDWLMRSGRVVLEDVRPAQWPAKPWWWRSGWVITTYRVVGPGEAGPAEPRMRRRFLRPRRAVRRWSGPNGHRFKLHRPGSDPLYSH